MTPTLIELREKLTPIYGAGETAAIIRLIFHALKGWSPVDMIIHEPDELSPYIKGKIQDILRRLLLQEPIQYILGEASFYGLKLKVTPDVLIPRPETEFLVDLVVKRFGKTPDLRVLDIGTGSGAIAIALARHLPFSRVEAIDISTKALEIARENARNLKAKVEFLCADVFLFPDAAHSSHKYDILISNPPYIGESEKAGMEANVLCHEPYQALFVPDDNPLIFYSRIAEIASVMLVSGGVLYFEINPLHAARLAAMLRSEGFSDVEIIPDIHGRERFIFATHH